MPYTRTYQNVGDISGVDLHTKCEQEFGEDFFSGIHKRKNGTTSIIFLFNDREENIPQTGLNGDLSDEEISKLDEIYSKYLTVKTKPIYRVWLLVSNSSDPYRSPKHLNLKKGLDTRLQEEDTIVEKGQIQEKIYYMDEDKTLPVIKSVYEYDPLVNGYVTRRVEKLFGWISWEELDENGNTIVKDGWEEKPYKSLPKVYNSRQALKEGVKRRNNIIDIIKEFIFNILVVDYMTKGEDQLTAIKSAEKEGRLFFKAVKEELKDYVEVNDRNDETGNLFFGEAFEREALTRSWLNNIVNTPQEGNSVLDYLKDYIDYE